MKIGIKNVAKISLYVPTKRLDENKPDCEIYNVFEYVDLPTTIFFS